MSNQTSASEPQPVELTEELALAIVALAAVGKQLKGSRLKPRTIALLLRDMTGVSMGNIEIVLNALPLIEQTFLKPQKA